jgi:hypothetical protein
LALFLEGKTTLLFTAKGKHVKLVEKANDEVPMTDGSEFHAYSVWGVDGGHDSGPQTEHEDKAEEYRMGEAYVAYRSSPAGPPHCSHA